MSIWAVPRLAPPLPFLPEDVHGQRVLVVPFLYTGEQAQGQKLIQPVRDFGTTLGEHVGMAPFTAWQSGFDGLQAPGFRNYWKSHNFTKFSEGLLDTVLSAIANQPGPHCDLLLVHLGGAASRVDPLATAYFHRRDPFLLNIHTRWETAAEDQRMVAWARQLFDDAKPYATGSVYVNFVSDAGRENVQAAYPAETLSRLVELKRRYDPANLFRLNQNIQPEQAPQAAG
jgi:FAD/FMN-containing dehydrogenase